MKVSQIVSALGSIAPLELAAEWDNVGLLLGDAQSEVRKAMFCIDLTADVLDEALRAGAGMVVAYHPLIFKPISRLTAGGTPVAYAAARAGLAVYSPHTAMDVVPGGTNDVLADALGLESRRALEPLTLRDQCKVVTFVPPADLSRVAEAAFAAGAGRIGNYFDCAFFGHGIGAFCGNDRSRPSVGVSGRHEANEELRLEAIAPRSRAATVCQAIRSAHSYETPAIDVYALEDFPEDCGMGRVGKLAKPATVDSLVAKIKKTLGVSRVQVARAAGAGKKPITIAACGAGSCGNLYRTAVGAGATLYLTGEMRHHDALAASAAGLTVVCVGHSNSERNVLKSLAHRTAECCKGLKTMLSRTDRDPFDIA